jgi:LPS-assembly lipoprotein
MSSSDRRTVLALLAALPLAGCGFTPAYAPNGAAAGLRGRIALQPPTDRDTFVLVRQLEQRLGRTEAATHDLGYTIKTDASSGGFTPEGDITRYQLHGTAIWTLTERQSDTRVAGGTARSFTSWSATGTTIAGLTAEEDAARRLMVILADQIASQIIATAPDLAP